MTVVHLTDNVVDVRYVWASTIDEVVAKVGGSPSDFAEGDFPVRSTRDSGTGEITPYVTPALTDAERAARIELTKKEFFGALWLLLDPRLDTISDPVEHIKGLIRSAVAAGELTATEGAKAIFNINIAQTWPRIDPDAEDAALLLKIAGITGLGLSSGDLDNLFLAVAAARA